MTPVPVIFKPKQDVYPSPEINRRLAINTDGILAIAGGDNSVRLWSVSSDKTNQPLPPTIKPDLRQYWSLAYNQTGKLLASGTSEGEVWLWQISGNISNAKILNIPNCKIVYNVAFGDNMLAAVCEGKIYLIDVRDPQKASRVGEGIEHDAVARSIAFSPNGKILASGGSNGIIKLWAVSNTGNPSLLKTLTRDDKSHNGMVYDLAFNNAGNLLASVGNDSSIILWNVTNPAVPVFESQVYSDNNNKENNPVFCVAFSPNGKSLATGNKDTFVRIWNVSDPKNIVQTLTLANHQDEIYSVVWSFDGKDLYTAGGKEDATSTDKGDRLVRRWGI
jgi:WD40 repeat protein